METLEKKDDRPYLFFCDKLPINGDVYHVISKMGDIWEFIERKIQDLTQKEYGIGIHEYYVCLHNIQEVQSNCPNDNLIAFEQMADADEMCEAIEKCRRINMRYLFWMWKWEYQDSDKTTFKIKIQYFCNYGCSDNHVKIREFELANHVYEH